MPACRAARIDDPAARLPAARLLVERSEPQQLVFSRFGLREGLLLSRASGGRARRSDPLIAARAVDDRRAARPVRRSWRRCSTTGSTPVLHRREPPTAAARASPPACSATSAGTRTPISAPSAASRWRVHGNWVGIDGMARVMLAQALFSAIRRRDLPDERIADLCSATETGRAVALGPGDPARRSA